MCAGLVLELDSDAVLSQFTRAEIDSNAPSRQTDPRSSVPGM